ncbi:hypothetical protein ACHWQZ_G002639 [Mnemiopsis leidyi]
MKFASTFGCFGTRHKHVKLTKETKSNRVTKEALITERDELSSELKELKENVDNKISTLSKQHSDTVANITATLLSSHQTETKQLKEGYESTIADLRSQLSVIEDKHTNHVHNIRDRHTQEIATLHREHEDQRNQLILSHQQEIARMEGTQRALEEQNEYLDSQIKEKDEIMQEEIQSQVQEQVQRYSTINAELQSLRDVIDMRNAEIKKLNTKIKDLEIKAEDARALEKDLRSYKDHNEQLRATIEMKAESERTLNLTQESLYQSIKEKESDNKNMVLKCEELQFRLSLLEEKQGGHNGSNIFAPANYSTPACSPRRQMSEPPFPADYVSSPRPSNRFSDSTDRLDQQIRPTLDQNMRPALDQKNTRPHRHRHTSLDSGTYRVRGKPSTVSTLDQLQLFGKASRPSRESHVSEGESHVSGGKIRVSKENKHVSAKSPSETEKRRDSPVWIDRRRCCSANQTRRVEEYTGSGTSVSSPGSEGSKVTPSPHSRTLWFAPLSPADKTRKTQPWPSPGLSPEIPKPSMFSKSESHLLSPESSVSGKPPSINRASLRLQRHKLKNNTFTYSKYLAQKDRSETDLITSRSNISLNSWPDDTCRESSTALLISDDKDKAPKSLLGSDLKDKVPKSGNKTHGDAYIAESFGDTFITFDASAMEERSTKKDSTRPLKSPDSKSIAKENKTDRQKLLEKYRNKKAPTDVTKPLSPGDGKSGGGRKSPGDILSTRGRNKSPGSASNSTTDLFMKVSSSLSRRLSLNRKHKKGRVTPETSSQIDIERYLYGKESEVCRREIGLDYTDLNYTVNNYSEL